MKMFLNFLKFIDSKDILIIGITSLFFILFVIFLFEVLLSKLPEILNDKEMSLITDFAKYNEQLKQKLELSANTDNSNLKILADNDRNDREKYNKDLFIKYMLPWIIVISLFIILVIIYTFYKKIPYTKYDMIPLTLTIFAFLSEILFYFILIVQWKYINENIFYKYVLFRQ